MSGYSASIWRGRYGFQVSVLILCLAGAMPLFATKGIFQGRVIEGTKREVGKYIYVAGRGGYMRRVDVQGCHVRFDAALPAAQRVRSASESLREGAEVRVTAEQRDNGEWMATEIVILKLAEIDKVRVRA